MEFREKTPFRSVYDTMYDVVVVGTGYIGFAAALGAKRAGLRVLLVGDRGDLLWESGRCFEMNAGAAGDSRWNHWYSQLEAQGAAAHGLIDGALAEVIANRTLLQEAIDVLYFAVPIAHRVERGTLVEVLFGTKSGRKSVRGRRWIDATESAVLAGRIDPALKAPGATASRISMLLQGDAAGAGRVAREASGDRTLELRPSLWKGETLFEATFAGELPSARQGIVQGLEAWKEVWPRAWWDELLLSHTSIETYPLYRGAADPFQPVLPANCLPAFLWATNKSGESGGTLADRFALGMEVAGKLPGVPAGDPGEAATVFPEPAGEREQEASVLISGLGTGGALAAIAAGRQAGEGERVVGMDLLSFAGGIGTGGGIHSYYYGEPGGVQNEVDHRVRAMMDTHGRLFEGGPFNPFAKMIVLEQMLGESRVECLTGRLLCGVEREGRRVKTTLWAGPGGLERWSARGYVDATGDGDLCRFAGVPFRLGREGDGQPSAYSQSSGRIVRDEATGRVRMVGVNFDAGWCDPTGEEDLTRARQIGIDEYWEPRFDERNRPTYIAPALGLRQGPQFETDALITMEDLIERRQYEDAVAYAACFFDTHNHDLLLDAPLFAFLRWGAGYDRRKHVGCAIPYRALLPAGVDNVWIGSRCLGVTQEAHYVVRMQRDLQRIGEAVGLAAALAAPTGLSSREIPIATVRTLLRQSGALGKPGEHCIREFGRPALINPREARAKSPEAALEALRRGEAEPSLWWLFRHGRSLRHELLRLLENGGEAAGFGAALVLGMWGERVAIAPLAGVLVSPWNRKIEAHFAAAAALCHCADASLLPLIAPLAREADRLALDARVAVLRIVEAMLEREPQPGCHREPVAALLERFGAEPVPGACYSNAHQLFETVQAIWENPAAEAIVIGRARATAAEDHTWQLDLVATRIASRLGLPVRERIAAYRLDSRAIVRRAFAQIPARKGSGARE